jgi:magnesium transporter
MLGAMFRVLDVRPDCTIDESTDEARVRPPGDGGGEPLVRWIDLEAQDARALALLGERFGFHPLTLEDCATFDQRAKVEEYGSYLFIVTHSVVCPRIPDVEVLELHAFLGHRYVITVHDKPLPAVQSVWKRLAGDPHLMTRGADFVYYLIADAQADLAFPLLDQLADDIEELEDRVIDRPLRTDLQRIFALKSALVTIRKVLSPQRDVFGLLAKRGGTMVSEKTSLYFRDTYDHLVRITESVEASRDLLGNALDAYLTMISNRTNEIMKRLTILSSIFLPLTFVTGFFGQNFTHMPFGSDALMWTMVGACLALPTGMLLWFYRSGWFQDRARK